MVLGLALLALPAAGQQSLNKPMEEPKPYFRDSGELKNISASPRVVHTERVAVDGAAWIRVYFGAVELGQGSALRLRSELDGEVQQLDAGALALWSNSSAYFNGDAVTVDLLAGPGTTNRMVIERAAWELSDALPAGGPGQCGICGADDRTPSSETWAARLLPAGCSSSVYNSQSCMVSAGHCMGGGMVVQFNVPPSSASCNIVNPPIADQFPLTAFLFSNGGVGQDWAVMTAGANNLGQKPFERYGTTKPIATTPPAVGQPLTIWGYGVDATCVKSQVQQTSSGSVVSVGSTLINHDVDATFGNSGSGIIRNGTEILAIVTHCPCPNWGTRVDHPSFVAARSQLCPEGPAVPATLGGFTIVQGSLLSGNVSEMTNSDDSYVQVQSALLGSRHNFLMEASLQSPFTTVSELNLTVEIGPANATPVFHGVSIFNFDTSAWESKVFATTSTSSDTTDVVAAISNPNAYVSGSGEVRLRILQTARVAQVPGGYTALVDQVAATVRP
jgi:hypothetical protein